MRTRHALSVSGRLTMPFSRIVHAVAAVRAAEDRTAPDVSNAFGFGALGTSLIVPPMEPAPYSVP